MRLGYEEFGVGYKCVVFEIDSFIIILVMAQSSSDSNRSRSPPRQRQEEDASSKRLDSDSCLYIGNIDKRLSEDRLRAAFEAHG